MSEENGFHYFLKKEERKSLQPKKPRKRMTSFLIILGDILFILLVYTLVFKPAMDKFDKQQQLQLKQFYIGDINFSYTVFNRKNEILIDIFAHNKGEKTFEISKEEFYLKVVSSKTPYIVKPLFDNYLLKSKEAKHIPFFIEKSYLKDQFYFIVIYKGQEIKESETIEISGLK